MYIHMYMYFQAYVCTCVHACTDITPHIPYTSWIQQMPKESRPHGLQQKRVMNLTGTTHFFQHSQKFLWRQRFENTFHTILVEQYPLP